MACPLNILLVLNHPDSIEVLLRLLSPRGHEVRATGTLKEAVEVFDEGGFDVLIADIALPDGDGCKLVRKLLKKQPSLFAIAHRGDGTDKDGQRCLDAGFRGVLARPYSLESLDLLLKEARKAGGEG